MADMKARHTLAAFCAALVALLALAATPPPAAHANLVNTGFGCAPLQVINVPGTWETSKGSGLHEAKGLIAGVTNKLDKREASITYVPYIARIADGYSMGTSWKNGFEEANNIIGRLAARCPDSQYVIMGFSQGAGIAGDIICGIEKGQSPINPDQFLRGVLFADPLRAPGSPTPGTMAKGGGILGVRDCGGFGSLGDKVISPCRDGDIYCSMDQLGTIIPQIVAALGQINLFDPANIVATAKAALELPEHILSGHFTTNGYDSTTRSAAQVFGKPALPWGNLGGANIQGERGAPTYLIPSVDIDKLSAMVATSLAYLPALQKGLDLHGATGEEKVDADTEVVDWAAQWIVNGYLEAEAAA